MKGIPKKKKMDLKKYCKAAYEQENGL